MIVEENVYLEHFGKKGMRWGQRRTARSNNRALNKASLAKDWDKQTKDVTAAREKLKSGALKKDLKTAKVQFKSDKQTMGSREARKILNKKKVKVNEIYSKSQEAKTKNGQRAAVAALVVLSGLRVAVAAKS